MNARVGLITLSLTLLFGCTSAIPDRTATVIETSKDLAIAFMPDIHFHDVYGDFTDDAFDGLLTETADGKQYATIRTMQSQLHSTRLFNENYFALLAALDDVVKRNIRYVALPGDFSDDGQPLHMRGLKRILDRYHRDYGIEFFAAPGNHDPTRPMSHPAGKPDYLGKDGKAQPIFSHQHPYCRQKTQPDQNYHPLICSDDVQELGYQPIMELLGEHGFYPKPEYQYFETPYSRYRYDEYDYRVAQQQATFANRHYEICHQGTGGQYKHITYSDCYSVPDTSYLVEPIAGLWLLAIDANVYQPKLGSNGNAQDAQNFSGSGDAGYNKVITHKTHLLEWISDVVARTEAQGKTLIAFSHFPMQEFYDGAADDIAQLMGDNTFQLTRRPATNTSKILADTGLKIHIAGHMHINDTGVYRGAEGKVLFNIQAPSLAAYIPAYKIVTLKDKQQLEVETVVLNDVPRFAELFPHYHAEWNYLHGANVPNIWNRDILQAKNYHQFTEWHLRELARLRFLPQDWPADIRTMLAEVNGREMLILSQLEMDIGIDQLTALLRRKNTTGDLHSAWKTATDRAEKVARHHGLALNHFTEWNGEDLSLDFYRLCNADQLALSDISAERLAQYKILAQQFIPSSVTHTPVADGTLTHEYQARLGRLLQILVQFSQGEPSDHFLLDLKSGKIKPLS